MFRANSDYYVNTTSRPDSPYYMLELANSGRAYWVQRATGIRQCKAKDSKAYWQYAISHPDMSIHNHHAEWKHVVPIDEGL